jgi:hypothetical protein
MEELVKEFTGFRAVDGRRGTWRRPGSTRWV